MLEFAHTYIEVVDSKTLPCFSCKFAALCVCVCVASSQKADFALRKVNNLNVDRVQKQHSNIGLRPLLCKLGH